MGVYHSLEAINKGYNTLEYLKLWYSNAKMDRGHQTGLNTSHLGAN